MVRYLFLVAVSKSDTFDENSEFFEYWSINELKENINYLIKNYKLITIEINKIIKYKNSEKEIENA